MQQPQRPRAPRDPSPPDVRDELVRWARDPTNHKAATHTLLDAGRATPNWIATTPRDDNDKPNSAVVVKTVTIEEK